LSFSSFQRFGKACAGTHICQSPGVGRCVWASVRRVLLFVEVCLCSRTSYKLEHMGTATEQVSRLVTAHESLCMQYVMQASHLSGVLQFANKMCVAHRPVDGHVRSARWNRAPKILGPQILAAQQYISSIFFVMRPMPSRPRSVPLGKMHA
jgi:hypothetical protein